MEKKKGKHITERNYFRTSQGTHVSRYHHFVLDFVLTAACIGTEISSNTDRSATNETLQSIAPLVIPSILC